MVLAWSGCVLLHHGMGEGIMGSSSWDHSYIMEMTLLHYGMCEGEFKPNSSRSISAAASTATLIQILRCMS